MILILLGAPGAGKGTQAERIRAQYNLSHLSTGDLLRGAVTDATELGKLAKGYMESGKLVPDEVIIGIIKDYLTQHKDEGILLDGFPRTTTQAEGLNEIIGDADVMAVSLEVPDDVVIGRLSSRWSCRACGKVYNSALGNLPSTCDCSSSGDLYQRDDDKPKTIANRLEIFHTQTEPIKDYYKEKGVLITVDGTGTPNDIFARIKDRLG